MKKAVVYRYGAPEVIEIIEVEKPQAKGDEVVIQIHAFSVASGDVRRRIATKESLPMWPVSKLAIGIKKPKSPDLGFDFAGEIVEIGPEVSKYKVGDKVFGMTGKGTNMEYRAISEQGVFTFMPNNLSYEEATSLAFGALTTIDFYNKAGVSQQKSIMINGASGAVGTMAIQIANHQGLDVTAVCSKKNEDLVRSLGAKGFVDYRTSNVYTGQYDIVFDTVGKLDFRKVKKILKKDGKFLMLVFNFKEVAQMLTSAVFGGKKAIGGIAKDTLESMEMIREYAEKGILKPVIDKTYTFEDIREAHRHVETGHKVGSVIVNFK